MVGWYQEVFTLLPAIDDDSIAFRDLLLKSRTERLKAVNTGIAAHPNHRAALEKLRTTIPQLATTDGPNSPGNRSIAELRIRLRTASSHFEEAIAALLMADLRPEVTVGSIAELLTAADRCRTDLAHIESQDRIRQLLGGLFQGIDSDLKLVTAPVRFAESVVNKTIPGRTADWLLSEEYFSRLGQLRQWLNQAAHARDDMAGIRSEIRTLAVSNDWHADDGESLETLADKAERALEQREELAQWLHFLRARADSAQAGLAKLTGLADAARIEPLHLLPAFRFIFHNTLARSVFAEHPDLFGFSGVTQDQIREQFAKADKQVIRLIRRVRRLGSSTTRSATAFSRSGATFLKPPRWSTLYSTTCRIDQMNL